jgi:hypothetical protein
MTATANCFRFLPSGFILRLESPPRALRRSNHSPLRSAPTKEKAITQTSDDRLCQAWRVPF